METSEEAGDHPEELTEPPTFLEEEEMSDNKNSEILRAGGLDGGFNKIELEELLK